MAAKRFEIKYLKCNLSIQHMLSKWTKTAQLMIYTNVDNVVFFFCFHETYEHYVVAIYAMLQIHNLFINYNL